MSSLKSGHFWELEAWMGDHGVSIRELELLTGFGKSVLGRLICGQFVRVDPALQAKLRLVTKGAVGDQEWASFIGRRLADRTIAA